MIYVHPETGLQINVRKVHDVLRETDYSGQVHDFIVGKKLVTDGGQEASMCDSESDLLLDIYTLTGVVRVIKQ